MYLAIALVVVGLLFLPQLSSQLLGSARVAADRTQALEAGTLAASFDLKPSLFGDTLLAFITNRTPWTADPLFAPTVAGLWLVGLAWLVWRRRAVSVALLAWMLLPLPLIAWFAFQTGFSFAPRRLIFILPVFLLVVATGVTTLGRLAAWAARRLAPGRPELARWASWATIGLVMLAFVKGSIDPITSYYARPKQDWKGLATILRTIPQPDDAIVVLPNASGPLEWYYPGPHNVIAKDLVPKLQTLCEKSPAVYVAVAGTGERLSAERRRLAGAELHPSPAEGSASLLPKLPPRRLVRRGRGAALQAGAPPRAEFPRGREGTEGLPGVGRPATGHTGFAHAHAGSYRRAAADTHDDRRGATQPYPHAYAISDAHLRRQPRLKQRSIYPIHPQGWPPC